MELDFTEFKKLLDSKLPNKSLSLAVLNAQGSLQFEFFRAGVKKKDVLDVASQTIDAAQETKNSLSGQFPEYMMYKGNDAFLLILPSQSSSNYYVVFCNNGLNVGMTRICVQNTIVHFENKN